MGSRPKKRKKNLHRIITKVVGLFQKYHNTLCRLSNILHKHCLQVLLGPFNSQKNLKTTLIQNFGGTIRSIVVFLKKASWIRLSCDLKNYADLGGC